MIKWVQSIHPKGKYLSFIKIIIIEGIESPNSYFEVIKEDFSENKNAISFQDSKFPKCLPKGVNAHDSYYPPNSTVAAKILIYK